MRGILERHYSVRCASDGLQALEMVRAQLPEIIVSDVRMPGMDGISFARALRADAQSADLPLLFVSAKTQPEDRLAGLELAQDYLCKPFGVAELQERVAKLLPSRPTAQPAHLLEFRAQLEEVVQQRLGESTLTVTRLAKHMAVSMRTLQERFHELDFPPPSVWLLERRLRFAKTLLETGRYRTVGEVAAAVGLSRSYFSRAYRAWSGVSPSKVPRR